MSTEFKKVQDRIYRTVEIGYTLDPVSRAYDIVSVARVRAKGLGFFKIEDSLLRLTGKAGINISSGKQSEK